MTLGRFQDEFVEARRAALERMLNKIAQHPLLQRDIDFKLFIESEAFNTDVKQREKANAISGESKGFMGSIGLGGSYSGKIPDADDVVHFCFQTDFSGSRIAKLILMSWRKSSRDGLKQSTLLSSSEKV